MSSYPPAVAWQRARVLGVVHQRPGYQLVSCTPEVQPTTQPAAEPHDAQTRAVCLTQLNGPLAVGDLVLLNVAALERGLGTGGHAMVVARLPDGGVDRSPDAPGHVVKARYTPLQAMVLGVDEQGSPHHDVLAQADSIDSMPVVVADLHSALPAILAGVRHRAAELGRPAPRVGYVMTDGAALPAAYSSTVAALREAGWLDACITTGQAYGGDLEAVSVHSGLLAARLVVGADVAVVIQGPGNVGTDTRWGFSGVACGEALNAAAVLGGRPVAALRVSAVDSRPRHRGVSHHSLTALARVALAPADVVVPLVGGAPELEARVPGAWDTDRVQRSIDEAVAPLGAPVGRHRLVRVPVAGLAAACHAAPAPMQSMGRSFDADPTCFVASAAAGAHASDLQAGRA